jgi:predicted phosphohydrolase
MNVFALSDLHLSATGEKPMDIFGPQWTDHRERIEANWRRSVAADDLVLLCGDLSWAMRLPEARPDLDFIESLPGVKYFIRGNHDYWLSSPQRVRSALGPTMHLIRFDAAVHGGVGLCGVRGWVWPGHPDYQSDRDERLWHRELKRLALSLGALAGLDWDVAVAMLHYPPAAGTVRSEMVPMLQQAGVRYCIYGHVHGEALEEAFEGEEEGITYRCTSADHLDFCPTLLMEHPDRGG